MIYGIVLPNWLIFFKMVKTTNQIETGGWSRKDWQVFRAWQDVFLKPGATKNIRIRLEGGTNSTASTSLWKPYSTGWWLIMVNEISGWWFGTFGLFSISYMGCHPSHWRTPSFFKMVFNHQPVKVLNPATSGAGISLIPLWMLHMLSMAAIRFWPPVMWALVILSPWVPVRSYVS